MISRLFTSFQSVHSRFTWISLNWCLFFFLGEFRIRGLQIGLYLRNISNENLGDRNYRGWLKTNNKQGYLFLSKMAKVSIQFSDPG